jgi:hypothetical protein
VKYVLQNPIGRYVLGARGVTNSLKYALKFATREAAGSFVVDYLGAESVGYYEIVEVAA